MKPHPRIRKTIKWGGAAVTVLLVVVWIGSELRPHGILGTNSSVVVARGNVDIQKHPQQVGTYYVGFFSSTPLVEIGPRRVWWPRFVPTTAMSGQFEGYWIDVPMWMITAPIFSLTATAWRLDTLARRRVKLNLCPKCGYDRTGILKDAKCPECGSGGTPA